MESDLIKVMWEPRLVSHQGCQQAFLRGCGADRKGPSGRDRDAAFGANGQVLTTVMGGSDVANAFALTAAGRILVAGQAQMTAGRDATLFRHLNEVGSAVGEQGGFPLMSVTPNPVTAGGPMRIVCQGALPGDLAAELVGPLGGSVPMPVRRQDGADHLGLIVPATVAPGVHILRLVAADGAVVGRARLVVER